MRKTTLYLADEEAEGLRRLARERKRPQAELIRQAIQALLSNAPKRRFHSMGVGASGGASSGRWNADDLYRKVRGED